MRSASLIPFRSKSGLSSQDRAGAITLTILFHIALIALLLWITPGILPIKKEDLSLSTFNVPAPNSGNQSPAKAQRSEEKTQDQKASKQAPQPTPVTPTPKPDTTMPKPQVEAPSFLQISPDQYAASDIGKMQGRNKSSDGNGKSSGATYGPGEGPGGAQLYNAQWKREPTGAELAGYLKADMPRNGYGLIACRTIENYHVENCRVLEERPLGSGYGQAVRRAAWQFLVVPPRINGKPQIGEWVRIRIEYTEGEIRPR
ncbi:MAG: hypothetical protein E2598_03345 [Sphingobium sp.]|nr:hypothetical protein [Sphingobium sp.]